MKNINIILIIPVLFLFALAIACDNDGSGNANAQPSPMEGTDATGTVRAPSAQTCPANVMIEGLKAQDVVVLEIIPAQNLTGEATITNLTANTSAKCSGMIDPPLISEAMGCIVSSSNIPGIAVSDMLDISVAFSSQVKEIEFANLSGSTGLECAFANLDIISATN